jgi:hypothetical protein
MSIPVEKKEYMSHATSSYIDPYSLLGVGIDSQIDEVRRAYYDLSLVCHPDKGGSVEDMVCVQAAYQFVKEGIQATGVSKANMCRFDELLESYRRGTSLGKVPQRFSDIERPADYSNNDDIDTNKQFDHAAFESLLSSQIIRSTISFAPPIVEDLTDPGEPINPDTSRLVVCAPVQRRNLYLDWLFDETDPENIATFDFSTDAPIPMFDYGAAFSSDHTLNHSDPREKRTRIEDIIKEREQVIDYPPPLRWLRAPARGPTNHKQHPTT